MTDTQIIAIEQIGNLIRIVRGHKVMLDEDLAKLYAVETRVLTQAVKRNEVRFPKDFMFRIAMKEYRSLISQSVISNPDESRRGGRRKPPMAFTEQGVAMLSSVLTSPRAVQVNIAIMRTFVRLRQFLSTNKALAKKLQGIEAKQKGHDKSFEIVFEAIGQLLRPEKKDPERKIGFGYNKD